MNNNIFLQIIDTLHRVCNYKSSESYWTKRYSFGRNSGVGSSENASKAKASYISAVLDRYQIKSVEDIGMGDGTFLRELTFAGMYTGMDVSPLVIEMAKNRWQKDSRKQFFLLSDYEKNKPKECEARISLDVILHLVENEVYYHHLDILFADPAKYVFILSTNLEEKPKFLSPHVRHRKVVDDVGLKFPNFELIVNGRAVDKLREEKLPVRFYAWKRSI